MHTAASPHQRPLEGPDGATGCNGSEPLAAAFAAPAILFCFYTLRTSTRMVRLEWLI